MNDLELFQLYWLALLGLLVAVVVAWGWLGWKEANQAWERSRELENELEGWKELLEGVDCG